MVLLSYLSSQSGDRIRFCVIPGEGQNRFCVIPGEVEARAEGSHPPRKYRHGMSARHKSDYENHRFPPLCKFDYENHRFSPLCKFDYENHRFSVSLMSHLCLTYRRASGSLDMTCSLTIQPVYFFAFLRKMLFRNRMIFITTKSPAAIASTSHGFFGASVASSMIGKPRIIAGKFW